MVAKVVLHKDQLLKETFKGGIKEKKVIGYPQENSPLVPYSNIFYWSHLTSDYGCIIPEHPHLGFEIITYVLKGTYETQQSGSDEWVKLSEGDVCIVHSGKGIRHIEKFYPRTEVLQVWLDPDYNQFRKYEPGIHYLEAASFPVERFENRYTWALAGADAPMRLDSEGVAVEIHELHAGFHSFTCPEDTVMSGFILDGYIEIDEKMMGKNDYFRIDSRREVSVTSLVNSKMLLTVSPYEPEYQMFSAARL